MLLAACRVALTNMMLLSDGETGGAWEPSKTQCLFGNREVLGRKVLNL